MADTDTTLADGVRVQLQGLSSADLNGKSGNISGPQRQNGRWPVLLECASDAVAIKAANLVVLPTQGSDGSVVTAGSAAMDASAHPRIIMADASQRGSDVRACYACAIRCTCLLCLSHGQRGSDVRACYAMLVLSTLCHRRRRFYDWGQVLTVTRVPLGRASWPCLLLLGTYLTDHKRCCGRAAMGLGGKYPSR